jgi:type IV pilus assembly protein PilW
VHLSMIKNKRKLHHAKSHQIGASLVELLVGLVIGLFATLAIMQVFSVFEGQKRTTSGSADAQTNGVIALMNIQRSVQMAGYGLAMPMADKDNSSLKCDKFADFKLDPADPTSTTNLFPIEIKDGGGTANDTITVRYSTSAKGAVPVEITQVIGNTKLKVENVIGCGAEMDSAAYDALYPAQRPNVVLIARGTTCGMAFIKKQPIQAAVNQESEIEITAVPDVFTAKGTTVKQDDKVTCMGNWASHTFDVNNNNELQRNQQAIVSGVVGLQAQYGVSSAATNNNVTSWVDATGTWANPAVADRNRIKAIRLAIVLRNGLKEKTDVTTAAPVAWTGSGTTQIGIDVSSLPDWKQYRYRVFNTTMPLRNMLWSKDAL